MKYMTASCIDYLEVYIVDNLTAAVDDLDAAAKLFVKNQVNSVNKQRYVYSALTLCFTNKAGK